MLHLTPAERAILQLMADGHTDQQIADRLRITASQFDSQTASLFARMGVVNQSGAVEEALRRGLLSTVRLGRDVPCGRVA